MASPEAYSKHPSFQIVNILVAGVCVHMNNAFFFILSTSVFFMAAIQFSTNLIFIHKINLSCIFFGRLKSESVEISSRHKNFLFGLRRNDIFFVYWFDGDSLGNILCGLLQLFWLMSNDNNIQNHCNSTKSSVINFSYWKTFWWPNGSIQLNFFSFLLINRSKRSLLCIHNIFIVEIRF